MKKFPSAPPCEIKSFVLKPPPPPPWKGGDWKRFFAIIIFLYMLKIISHTESPAACITTKAFGLLCSSPFQGEVRWGSRLQAAPGGKTSPSPSLERRGRRLHAHRQSSAALLSTLLRAFGSMTGLGPEFWRHNLPQPLLKKEGKGRCASLKRRGDAGVSPWKGGEM